MIGQFKGRQKTSVYGWVSDLAVARSGFNQIGPIVNLGIKHVFLCIKICWTPRVVLKPDPERRGF